MRRPSDALQPARPHRPVRLGALPRHHDLRRPSRASSGSDRRARPGRPRRARRQALDAGINFIDTADVYSEGLSEEITGQALRNLGVGARRRGRRDQGLRRAWAQGPNDRGASRGHIMDAVKASLKRLQLDHIDLYQIHGFDPRHADRGDGARARRHSCATGHVRYVGVSNWAGLADREGAGHRRAAGARALRLAAGLLHDRRPRPRARDRADAADREGRPDGVEPARRRPAVGQVRPRRDSAAEEGRRATLRLPAGRPRPRLRLRRRDARRSPTRSGVIGGAGGARLAAAPAGRSPA